MNTLYLSYDGMTDPLGQSQVLPYLCGLSQRGISITLVSFEKHEKFCLLKDRIHSICESNNINWIPLPYTKSPPVLSTIKDIYTLNKTVKKLTQQKQIDLIHCRSYITGLIGLSFKKKYNIPFLFDMRGFWANERVDGNIWSLTNPLFRLVYNFFKQKEQEYFSKSDYTVSLTHEGKKEIESWKLPELSPIEVIPCCTDTKIFNKEALNNELIISFKNELNINDNDFIISYLGSVGTWYMLNEMLDFYEILFESKANAKALFITQDDPKIILNETKKRGIPSEKIIVKAAQRNEVAALLSCSNASVFFIKPLYSKKGSSATKMGEIMNLGIPVICNHIGDNRTILQDICPQMIVNEFNASEYHRVIYELEKMDDKTKNNIIEKAKDYFSLDKGIEKYYNIYQKIGSN